MLVNSSEAVGVVIAINLLMAGLVGVLTCGLWHWKQEIAQITAQLERVSLNPQAVRYGLTLRRVQLAEVRLGVSQWQMRSRQFKQTLQLIQIIRFILLFRKNKGRSLRR
ncbi:MAG: hypothetical protein AAFO84_00060 [Cyanobacteria bacterium J06598_1]